MDMMVALAGREQKSKPSFGRRGMQRVDEDKDETSNEEDEVEKAGRGGTPEGACDCLP